MRPIASTVRSARRSSSAGEGAGVPPRRGEQRFEAEERFEALVQRHRVGGHHVLARLPRPLHERREAVHVHQGGGGGQAVPVETGQLGQRMNDDRVPLVRTGRPLHSHSSR